MRTIDLHGRFKLLLLLTVASLACGTAFSAEHKAGEVVLEPTSLTTPETGEVKFELGTFYAPENRNDPNSRIIGIGFARFRGPQHSKALPQFHLPGGPGNSYLMNLKADSRNLASTLKSLRKYAEVSDVILVDQRGWSDRGDMLKFDKEMPSEPLDQPASIARTTQAIVAAAKETVKEYADKGIDLRGYTVLECADDVYELRKALHYDKILLVGTSYGSQWSFAIMRRHPEIVTRALLSGVEPLDNGFDMPSHILEDVHRMWWDAEQDPAIKPYLPPGGLAGAAHEILRRLQRAPVQIKTADNRTKEEVTITAGVEDFQKHFLSLANPANLLSIYYEHYDLWGRMLLRDRIKPHTEGVLIRPVIDSAQGVTTQRHYLLESDPGCEYLGHWNWDSDVATADIWPSEDEGDEFRTPIVNQIPVVFAHGDFDFNTPLENTLSIAAFFPHSRVIIGLHGGHGILGPIANNAPDVFAKLLEFLRSGKMDDLPERVVLPKPNYRPPAFPAPTHG